MSVNHIDSLKPTPALRLLAVATGLWLLAQPAQAQTDPQFEGFTYFARNKYFTTITNQYMSVQVDDFDHNRITTTIGFPHDETIRPHDLNADLCQLKADAPAFTAYDPAEKKSDLEEPIQTGPLNTGKMIALRDALLNEPATTPPSKRIIDALKAVLAEAPHCDPTAKPGV